MKARLLLLPVAVVAGSLLGACGNPNAVTASIKNIDDTASVFALTGAPESGPTAVDISWPRPMRASPFASFRWDVVFDILGDTQAVAIPPAAVSAVGSAGLQPTTTPYDQITNAPTTGYKDSTAINIQAGSVFYVQSFSYQCTQQPVVARRYMYAKMIIDSVHYFAYDPITAPSGRVIYYRMRTDPNCGFTGLETGIPSN